MTEKADVYTRVTSKILADLERGNLTWLQPWQAGHQAGPVSRPLRAGGKAYRGINVLMLWAAAMEKNYSCLLWLTYKQAAELGGQVRKGEKGSLVVYANEIVRTDTDDTGADVEIKIPFMKGYTVFNAEQVDGLPGHFYATVLPLTNEIERLDAAEAFFANTNITIRHGGNRAFYSVDRDIVQMPEFQSFRDGESYYPTLGHECCHATRHPARLNRDLGRKRYGDAGYAMEELVALSGQSAPVSIDGGGLVQVANRRDPRASRSAPTSDVAARVGGACLPTWASPGMGVRGKGANRRWITLRSRCRPSFRSRSAGRRKASTATSRSSSATGSPTTPISTDSFWTCR